MKIRGHLNDLRQLRRAHRKLVACQQGGHEFGRYLKRSISYVLLASRIDAYSAALHVHVDMIFLKYALSVQTSQRAA